VHQYRVGRIRRRWMYAFCEVSTEDTTTHYIAGPNSTAISTSFIDRSFSGGCRLQDQQYGQHCALQKVDFL
jgi:hypothetical protein